MCLQFQVMHLPKATCHRELWPGPVSERAPLRLFHISISSSYLTHEDISSPVAREHTTALRALQVHAKPRHPQTFCGLWFLLYQNQLLFSFVDTEMESDTKSLLFLFKEFWFFIKSKNSVLIPKELVLLQSMVLPQLLPLKDPSPALNVGSSPGSLVPAACQVPMTHCITACTSSDYISQKLLVLSPPEFLPPPRCQLTNEMSNCLLLIFCYIMTRYLAWMPRLSLKR